MTTKMPTHHRVLLRGEHFVMQLNGAPARLGFYVTRYVRAAERAEAELLAVEGIRHELAGRVTNERSDPPMIHAEEVEPVDASGVPGVAAGFAFFPMDAPGS